jgi:endonuclease/exonuclease/phosphatase family metal-dependent hydrolase
VDDPVEMKEDDNKDFSEEPRGRLHILSYNIHKGFSQNRKFVLSRIKDAIQEVGADLVFLQEVIGEHDGHKRRLKDWPVETQLEFLADTVWPHHAYGKNAVYNDGHHGNAILSLHPFSFFENIDVSTNRFEKRGLLHGIIDLPGRPDPLHVICVHLDLLERGRLIQIQRLCERIEQHVPHEAPLVIAGDFNDWRENLSEILERTLEVKEVFKNHSGAHARSFPSWLPLLPLDRIYCRGLNISQARCLDGSPWNQLSDHSALYTELEF